MAGRRIVTLVVALFLAWRGGAAAQADPHGFLPPAEVFGDGWVVLDQGAIVVNPEAFRDGASAIYGGPAGARAIVLVYRVGDVTEVRQPWEQASLTFEEFADKHAQGWRRQDAGEGAQELAALPSARACDDAKLAVGEDRFYDTPTAVLLCALDPGVIVLILASGDLNGTREVAAAERVLAATLMQGTATPTP